MANRGVAQHTGDCQHGRNSCAIIGYSRAIQAGALLADVQRRGRGKYRIDVSAQRHKAASIGGAHSEYVAHLIHLHIGEPKLAKTARPATRCGLASPKGGAGTRETSICHCANCGSSKRKRPNADRTSGVPARRATSCCTDGYTSEADTGKLSPVFKGNLPPIL